MLILIAESKTMAPCNIPVSQNEYILHTPGLESRAEGIMDSLRNASSEATRGAQTSANDL